MRTIRPVIVASLAATVGIPAISIQTALSEDSTRSIASQIEGKWSVELMETEGEKATDAVGEFGVLRDGRFEEHLRDGTILRGTYILDTSRKPFRIDLRWEDRGGMRKGIFEIMGDSLAICVGGDKYPDSFKTKSGDGRVSYFYKRGKVRKTKPQQE